MTGVRLQVMTRDELKEVLDEGFTALRTEFQTEIAKLAPAPEEPEVEPAVKAEDVDAKIVAALEPIVTEVEGLKEIAEKTLDKLEALSKRSVVKRSLEGQEGDGGEPQELGLGDAIKAALAKPGQKVELK